MTDTLKFCIVKQMEKIIPKICPQLSFILWAVEYARRLTGVIRMLFQKPVFLSQKDLVTHTKLFF